MCVYTGLANIKNASTGTQWAAIAVLICFNIISGISWLWLGACKEALLLPFYSVSRFLLLFGRP